MEQFDLVIIGSGPAGARAAARARSFGLGVCMVEKAALGGTCLNRGCIPAKVFLRGAELLRDFRDGERYGVFSGPPRFEFSRLVSWKDTVVQGLRKNQSAALLKTGVRLETGEARIEEPGRVSIGAEKCVGAKAILIASGTSPARLAIPGSGLQGVYSSDDFLDEGGVFSREDVPARLVIIGGGVIGVEFADAYSAFGSEVTIIEALPSLLAAMDREIGQGLGLLFKKRGVKVITGTRICGIEKAGNALRVALAAREDGGRTAAGMVESVESDAVLMAAGRKPDVAALFAPGLMPALTEKGFIALDSGMMSSIPGIYAAGDISGGALGGGLQLAHAAEAEGDYAALSITHQWGLHPLHGSIPESPLPGCCRGAQSHRGLPLCGCAGGTTHTRFKPTGGRVVPACVYTSPEISSAGLSQAEAEREGIPAVAGKGVFGANGKAALENMERGFIKLVFHAEKRSLLGAQFFCNRATELVSWALAAIESGETAAHIAETVFPHPSYAETIAQAAKDALTRGGLGSE